LVYLPTYQ